MIIFEDTQISYEKESQHTSTAGQQTQQKSEFIVTIATQEQSYNILRCNGYGFHYYKQLSTHDYRFTDRNLCQFA